MDEVLNHWRRDDLPADPRPTQRSREPAPAKKELNIRSSGHKETTTGLGYSRCLLQYNGPS